MKKDVAEHDAAKKAKEDEKKLKDPSKLEADERIRDGQVVHLVDGERPTPDKPVKVGREPDEHMPVKVLTGGSGEKIEEPIPTKEELEKPKGASRQPLHLQAFGDPKHAKATAIEAARRASMKNPGTNLFYSETDEEFTQLDSVGDHKGKIVMFTNGQAYYVSAYK